MRRWGIVHIFARCLLTLLLYTYWWLRRPRLGFSLDRRRSPFKLTRYYMYERLQVVLAEYPCRGRVLTISGSAIVDMLSTDTVVVAEYPAVDIHALPFADNSFDTVVSDQVLEHVRDPAQAVRETLRVLCSEGVLIHTSCFLNPVHRYPLDLWRFTPEAMAELVGHAEIIDCGGWGNRSALLLMFMGVNPPIPVNPDHPLHRIAMHNDPKWPIVTWVVARK